MYATTIAAKLITNPTGTPTGLAVSIEIATSDDDVESIRAAFAEGFRLLRQAIEDQVGPINMPLDAQAQPPAHETPAPTYTPPATSEEAERRFFARYGAIIGGEEWSAAQRYIATRAPKPATVEGWIAAAAAVRDASQQERKPTIPTRNGRTQPRH